MAGDFWKTEKLIRTIFKSDTQVIRISAVESRNGTFMANLRVWYHDGSGDWKPGKGGLTVPYEALEDFIEAVSLTKDALEDIK